MATHLIGLFLGAEDDWPVAFEALLRRAALNFNAGSESHHFRTERMVIEPFSLRSKAKPSLVIDRLAWWYHHPREWLKKAALMDETYLINNPFTFQSMEKHSAYAAMIRLGMNVPETWLLPYKIGPDNPRWTTTAQRYNRLFNLDTLAENIGYPLYMKPFDGGGWRGVSRIDNRGDLHRAYDGSAQTLMHLQAGVNDFDHFARSLTIGPQTRIMNYRPERPAHERYDLARDFLTAPIADEIHKTSQVINAFFRWEFNSCEALVKGETITPIDYANACPDVAISSLHIHFPWAMTSLLKWAVFCASSGRRMALDLNMRDYFRIADRDDLTYPQKLAEYHALATRYFDADRFNEFCAAHLAHLDEVAYDYFTSNEFDDHLVRMMRESFQPHEHDHFIALYRHLFNHWAKHEGVAPKTAQAH